jgi:hypothetical protein
LNYNDIFQQLHKAKAPLAVFKDLATGTLPKAKGAEVDKAVAALGEAIERNRIGIALSTARTILVLLGPSKAIARLKREGVFRSSKYDFHAPVVGKLLNDWIDNAALYGFADAHASYLASATTLWSLAPAMRALQRSLTSRLHERDPVAIKTLLAEVDAAFAYGSDKRNLIYATTGLRTPEEMAEAFSYLLRLFHREIGLMRRHFGLLDSEAGYSPFYLELLQDAGKVCNYLEAEVLVEAFPYTAIRSGNGVRITSIDPTLEMSIRLGYVQSEMQGHIRHQQLFAAHQATETAPLSITRFAEKFFNELGDKVFELVQDPVPRYRLQFPFIEERRHFFGDDHAFLEDLSSIKMLGTEDYVESDQVVYSVVVGTIRVIDLLKVQRFFRFLQLGFFNALESHHRASEIAGLFMSSCLPVFRRENLMNILQHVVGEAKALEMLDLLTCNLKESYIDLQYTPIVASDGLFMLSLAVLANSNLVRNLLCHHGVRLTMRDKNDEDPMQASLMEALLQAGFLVHAEVETASGKNPLEVDLFAYKDGHLFLFECKNSFHPCNVFEMRTSYDHVVHAAEQLDQRKAWLIDPANQRRVFDKLSWDAAATSQVHTCIAIGNRVFNGYQCKGHPVRQVHELLNFLLRGYAEFNGKQRFRLWRYDQFTVDDLCAHLDGTRSIADLMNAMTPRDMTIEIEGEQLTFATYVLDSALLKAIVETRYPRVAVDKDLSSVVSAQA